MFKELSQFTTQNIMSTRLQHLVTAEMRFNYLQYLSSKYCRNTHSIAEAINNVASKRLCKRMTSVFVSYVIIVLSKHRNSLYVKFINVTCPLPKTWMLRLGRIY